MNQFAQIQKAIAAREPIREGGTDALRIVDGAGDGFPGIEIDDFSGHWLVQTRGGDFPHWLSEVPGPRSIHWKPLGDKVSPRWICGEKLEGPFVAEESAIRFWIDFDAGYSQGIFLDQRDNRSRVRALSGGANVLNCFAYTCAFGVFAALGGASTVNLDLSRRYLDWGKRNYELNGIDPASHDFIFGDTFDWLKRFRKKGRRFDLVILDPPTFSRNEKGQVFTVESGFGDLVALSAALLNEGGQILCTTNQRSLTPAAFRGILLGGLPDPGQWRMKEGGMPADFTGEQFLKTWWLQAPGGGM